MKVSFSTANVVTPKNHFAHLNAGNPIVQSNFVQFKGQDDSFVKSQAPVEDLVPAEEVHSINEGIVKMGMDGLLRNMATYTRSCAYANNHVMPTRNDLDSGMKYLPLSASSVSTYSQNGATYFPNEYEFGEIIKRLYNESEGLKGADESKFLVDEIIKLKEKGRMPNIKQFIKEDFARALDSYSQVRYSHPVTNEDEALQFAQELYDDENVRTIQAQVSNDFARKGENSVYFDILTMQKDSKAMLQYMDEHRDVFFAPPKTLRARYEENVKELCEQYRREQARNAEYEDRRSDWERYFDEGYDMT